jgi:hypothetical protein
MKRLVMTVGAVMLIAVVGFAIAQDDRPQRPGNGGERQGPPPRRPGQPPPRNGEGRPGDGPPGGPGHGPPGGPGPDGDHLRRPPRHDWENLKELDPQMYELQKSDHDFERQTGELSMKYRLAPSAGRSAVKVELTKAVNDNFEVRQNRRRLHLERLEEELERLRSAIEQRDEARAEIVQRRVDELTGESDELDF